MTDRSYKILFTIGLGAMLVLARSETTMVLSSKQNWINLLAPAGIATISIYIASLLVGIFSILTGLWRVEQLNRVALRLEKSPRMRGLAIWGIYFFFAYIYLYSFWQNLLSHPWTQLLFSLSLAQIVLLIAAPRRQQQFGSSELTVALTLFIYPRIVQEARILFPDAMYYRMASVVGLVTLITITLGLYSSRAEKARLALITWREKLGTFRYGLIALICFTPVIHLYLVRPETYIVYDDIRFAIFLSALWMVAYLGLKDPAWLVTRNTLAISLGALLFTALLARYLVLVIDYPFSLSWSEGNRFYDYSLMFGQDIYNYNGAIINPYGSPGRYFLWGILFLWKNLPIEAHRFWNLILQTVPVLIFSTLLTKKIKLPALRYGMLLWISLFLTMLAPLHPPIVIVSIISVFFAFDESPVKRGIALAIASYYAGLSRFTWVAAPAVIGALIDLLLYYPNRSGALWRRLMPTVGMIAISLIMGLVPSFNTYLSFAQGESTTAAQPLLWYRLLPNSTLGFGVLGLAISYTLPLVIVLAWWLFSKRWNLDWVQKTALGGALTGFFSIGLVISTKIGGGGDLHNMDMYLIILLIVFIMGLMSQASKLEVMPVWINGLILYSIFIVAYSFTPFYPGSAYSRILDLPKDKEIVEALSTVQKEAADYARIGEVLFLDQRQLLTFGYVQAIPFVPEYEKKYMMDQAMANNADYFDAYYDDLAKKRFALIVTENLKIGLKDKPGGIFAEENDAWVVWVSNPTLCFYEPIYLSKETNVQLLIPKKTPAGCEQYLK